MASCSNGFFTNTLLYTSAAYCGLKSAQKAASLVPLPLAHMSKLGSRIGISTIINGQDIRGKSIKEINDLMTQAATKHEVNPEKESQSARVLRISCPWFKKEFNLKTVETIGILASALFYGFCAYGFTQAVR